MRDVFLVFDGQLPSLPEVAAAIGNIGHVELSPLHVAAALADRYRCWVDLDTGQVYTSDAFVA